MRYSTIWGVLAGVLSLGIVAGCNDASTSDSSGNGKTSNGLGAICTTSADCGNGLTCQIDTTDYFAHDLCTGTMGSCSAISSQTACTAAWCVWDGICSGAAPLCSSRTSSSSCDVVDGC